MHECTRARGRFHPAHGARDDCIGIRARYWGRCRRPTVRNRFRPGQLPLVANVHKLSINSNAGPVTVCDRKKQPAIFHIGNPNLLPLNKLGGLMEDIRGDQTTVGGGGGGSLSLERWFQLVLSKDNANEDERLRWARLRDYLRMEHVMFALDGQDTKEMIKMVRGDLGECPPVDGTYLGRMWRNGRG